MLIIPQTQVQSPENISQLVKEMPDSQLSSWGLDALQLLCTAYWIGSMPRALTPAEKLIIRDQIKYNRLQIYGVSNTNDLTSIWVRSSKSNHQWMVEFYKALEIEFVFRFDTSRHRLAKVFQMLSILDAPNLPDYGLTQMPCTIPLDLIKKGDRVQSYRNYYMAMEFHKLRFTRRQPPTFQEN